MIVALALLWAQGAIAEEHQRAWVVETGTWNRGVAIGPTGDVLSADGSVLRVLARDTGELLESVSTCSVIEGGLFVDGAQVLTVCQDRIERVTLPGGAREVMHRNAGLQAAGHVAGRLAVGDGAGLVTLLDTNTWATVDTVDAEAAVHGLALDPTGELLAVGVEEGRVYLAPVPGDELLQLQPDGNSRSRALRFSADGRFLFAYQGQFRPRLYDVQTGAVRAGYRSGSWLTAAAFVGSDLIAATGSDGLVLYEARGGRPVRTFPLSTGTFSSSGVGLAVDHDGGLICAGDRDGNVGCWTSTPLVASTYATATADSPAPIVASSAGLAEGTLKKPDGSTLRVEGAAGQLPPVGATGTLSKHVFKQLGKVQFSAWLEVARVRVASADGPALTLELVEELSVMTVDGQPESHFTKGARVRLDWVSLQAR